MWPMLFHIGLNQSARYCVLPEYNSVNGLATFSIIIDDYWRTFSFCKTCKDNIFSTQPQIKSTIVRYLPYK